MPSLPPVVTLSPGVVAAVPATTVDTALRGTAVVKVSVAHVPHVTGQFSRTNFPMTESVHLPACSALQLAGSPLPLHKAVASAVASVVVVVVIVVEVVVVVVVFV